MCFILFFKCFSSAGVEHSLLAAQSWSEKSNTIKIFRNKKRIFIREKKMLNFHSFKIWRYWRWQHSHRVQPVTELTHSFLKFQLKCEENKSTYTPRYHQESVERSIGGWSHHTVISTFKLYSESSHTFLSRMYGTNIDYRRLSLQPLYRCVFVNLCACVSASVCIT